MTIQGRINLIAVTLLLVAGAAGASDDDIEPKIPPGYVPDEAPDEAGIWMEMHEIEQKIRQSPMLVRDADLNAYLQSTVCRVAGDYCGDIRVYLMRNPGFNASMTPNGMMLVWTGLLTRVTTTDQLAAVVGHEVAHYTRLHTMERWRSLKDGLAAGSIFDLVFLVATGVGVPLGQATAILGTLAFSREQEQEADFLGARMMAEAGLDPHAAYQVWNMIIAEEESAAVKRRKPGLFSKTHPDSVARSAALEEWVTDRYGPPPGDSSDQGRHVAELNKNYLFLMEDQLATNRFGRTEEMLDRHRRAGVEQGLVDFFYGEMLRQRGDDGDKELAAESYRSAIQSGSAPPEAYKNLGYLNLKSGDTAVAQENFSKYLLANPDASDKAMIEFYLEETGHD